MNVLRTNFLGLTDGLKCIKWMYNSYLVPALWVYENFPFIK